MASSTDVPILVDELSSACPTLTLPEVEEAAKVAARINRLKREKNAVILVHNYQVPEIYHGVADVTGDSLTLARKGAETDADIIILCGVHFMAETAKILNPSRKVLIPDLEAGCSLSESITAADVRALKEKYPGVPVVTYVNTSAEVKAETDVCCTSSNAVEIVNQLDSDRILFIPDEYLRDNVQKQTDKELIGWPGRCMVHELFTPEDVKLQRETHPDVYILAHPECSSDVIDVADFSGSTSAMIDAVGQAPGKDVLLMTECSMSDNVRQRYPNRNFVSGCQICPHMKKITLEKVERSLQTEQVEIDVPEEIRIRAEKALQRMLDLSSRPPKGDC